MQKRAKAIEAAEMAPDPGVNAVDRAAKILSVFTRWDTEMSLHELAKRTGFYKSTLLRLLYSLEKARLIQRRADKVFVLGPEVIRLWTVFQHGFRLADHVRPVLKRLVDQTGESCSFFQARGEHRICLVRENSRKAIRDHAMEGDLLPMRGAAGRLLTDLEGLRAGDIPKKLWRGLPYVSYGEVDKEMAGVAAPVFAVDNELVGAISLSGPASRFTASAVTGFKPVVMASAQELSLALGATDENMLEVKSGVRSMP